MKIFSKKKESRLSAKESELSAKKSELSELFFKDLIKKPWKWMAVLFIGGLIIFRVIQHTIEYLS